MKVLLYGLNYAPEPVGIGKFSGEMATWLAGRGHVVRVITAPPYFPEWQARGNRYRREALQGVAVWRCPLWVPRRPSGLTRLLHLASFALSSLPVLLAQRRWRPMGPCGSGWGPGRQLVEQRYGQEAVLTQLERELERLRAA